jgi:hypothetical protein
VITRQLQAAVVLSKLSTMNGKSSFVKVPVVITEQFKGIVSRKFAMLLLVPLES